LQLQQSAQLQQRLLLNSELSFEIVPALLDTLQRPAEGLDLAREHIDLSCGLGIAVLRYRFLGEHRQLVRVLPLGCWILQ
jgi:hypothetical protein